MTHKQRLELGGAAAPPEFVMRQMAAASNLGGTKLDRKALAKM